MQAIVTGVGHFTPTNKLTNHDLEKMEKAHTIFVQRDTFLQPLYLVILPLSSSAFQPHSFQAFQPNLFYKSISYAFILLSRDGWLISSNLAAWVRLPPVSCSARVMRSFSRTFWAFLRDSPSNKGGPGL